MQPMSDSSETDTHYDPVHLDGAEGSRMRADAPRPVYEFERKRPADFTDTRALIAEAVRRVALPRLLAAHSAQGGRVALSRIQPRDRDLLLEQVIASDAHVAEATLTVLGLRGVGRQDIVANLFAPVAQSLQDLWQQDDITFADLTLATGRLHRLLRSSSMPQPVLSAATTGGRLLVSGLPGVTPGFAATALEDIFRCAQWDTERLLTPADGRVAEVVAKADADVLVLCVNEPSELQRAARFISQLRRELANSRLLIIVYGPPLGKERGLWSRIGADATTSHPEAALIAANKLLQSALQCNMERS
jgi:MerR family transcriptional regulator, light-induced transcriptional regulator